ncbi:probable terpene synthase 6 isoform X2 [Hevea brasiliensis]|uniref:probable terpene synthase 6 isoform X2 n=1 Tax=Hevea brasiliensis TaxID=3981 RepID=UPI0025F4E7F0|nr:probable terpene synthase 6 isoform X2 [Hevea brasiliensis]
MLYFSFLSSRRKMEVQPHLQPNTDQTIIHSVFPPPVWDSCSFTYFSLLDSEYESWTRRVEALKEKVKDMLMADASNPIKKIELINLLCRLGLSYHFEREIEEQLIHIFNWVPQLFDENDYDLYTTALLFQVLRQHGFKMTCDVFKKFKDSNGEFKKSIIKDVRGILSLYEASFMSVHGEDILDEALEFTRSHLESLAMQSKPHYSERIKNALILPFHKGVPRVEAWQYISFYEKEESPNEFLLEFAKLDFNRVQLLQREELKVMARCSIDATDELPDYMKVFYKELLNLFEETENIASKEGRSNCAYYVKEEFKNLLRSYRMEAQWFNEGYVPTFDVYLQNGSESSTYGVVVAAGFIGMEKIAGIKDYQWLQSNPKIVKAVKVLGRLENDIASHQAEQKRGDSASSVECYMKEHDVLEKKAVEEILKICANAWKDINEECMKPTALPSPILKLLVNVARITEVVYRFDDSYTNPSSLKDKITALFLKPLPLQDQVNI